MKRLSLLLALSILPMACTAPTETMDNETPAPRKPAEARSEELAEASAPPDKNTSPAEAELHPAVADWLLYRQVACNQKPSVIDAQLERQQRAGQSSAANDEFALVHSQLQALMLASCDPARTPGIFRQLLQRVKSSAEISTEYHALFELMGSQLNAYAALERRYQELDARHQKTIEGIGNIERFLEPQAEPDQ